MWRRGVSRAIEVGDFRQAVQRVKATVKSEDLGEYERWDRQFGSGGNEGGKLKVLV